MLRFLVIYLLFLSIACTSTTPSPPNKFSDIEILSIYDLRDRRSADSLIYYLRSPNPVYRAEAALAFASIQDSSFAVDLGNSLLEDENADVRKNAAYALGQTGGFQALNALIPATTDKDKFVVQEVLEALGKVGNVKDFGEINDQPADSVVETGWARAIYHLGVRGKSTSILTKKASAFLTPEHCYETRLAAAHYFGRSRKVEGTGYEKNLIRTALSDVKPEVRMAAANGFKHIDSKLAVQSIEELIISDKDYRVRVNATRALQAFELTLTEKLLIKFLQDQDPMVQVAASEVIRNKAANYSFHALTLQDRKNQRVYGNLLAAFLKSGSTKIHIDSVLESYSKASPYFKAYLLSALGETKAPANISIIGFLSKVVTDTTNEKVVQAAAAASVVNLDRAATSTIPKKDFIVIYKKGILLGDPAVIATFSDALADSSLHYKRELTDLDFLYKAQAKLHLPKDVESLKPLEHAIAYLEGKGRPADLVKTYNHPIDWDIAKDIPKDQRVELETTKGKIIIRLFVEESPGSVVNFIDLINKKYFDGKYIHRVVPNFVIQSGCKRGDGFGSEAYSIRSEFSGRRYTTGSVGMASAGKDTEGTQWFITHSPTPHLDGGYTIFAETEAGQQVVDALEVGDRIIRTSLLKPTP